MAKSKYEYWLTDYGLLLLEAWARNGLTDEQIAHNMGVSRKTLSEWKIKYRYIGGTLKKNKEIADAHVENALYKRAIGYEYEEETQFDFEGELRTQKIVKKHMPPDVTAQIYWLKNRKAKQWRDKPEYDSSQDNEALAEKSLTIEELKKLARENPL